MSTIARKLCHDIVEPVLKPSPNDSKKLSTSENFENTFSNSGNNVKSRQTIKFDKKKSVKIVPSNKTDISINKGKFSKKGIKTKSVNTAINTLNSVPISCDNNSLTLIHKQNHQKGISKGNQTQWKKNSSISDKSCTNCVETVSCGTQFIDNNINGLIKQSCTKLKSNIVIHIQDGKETYKVKRKETLANEESFKFHVEKSHMNIISKPSSLRYVGTKCWALSNYPTRGPDF
ncbi:unnamed protein product [Euphydryas editha]|uniref:Uncharacterized protein n=1 Tax=Euphydryas editha TaxID=104508 RepID=A0AAU9U8Q6_EUPED|nr:unnamed protein product [Euphydryas editha]